MCSRTYLRRVGCGGAGENPLSSDESRAGLGLDPLSQKLIHTWIKQPHLLQLNTLPLTIDQNQSTDRAKKKSRVLARDENFNYRAAYGADLHSLLYKALPLDVVWWGHMFLSFSVSDDKTNVKVKSKILQRGEIIDDVSDLLIAVDGCLSSMRQTTVVPDHKLRYSGYCAWRRVLYFSDNEKSETIWV